MALYQIRFEYRNTPGLGGVMTFANQKRAFTLKEAKQIVKQENKKHGDVYVHWLEESA